MPTPGAAFFGNPKAMITQELKANINRLKKLDGNRLFREGKFRVFGSGTHKYKFNPCLRSTEIALFEKKYGIQLPDDYKHFLLTVGNGGCGPFYGLLSLQNWNTELAIDDQTHLQQNFPYTESWNSISPFDNDDAIDYESPAFIEWEQAYYDNKHCRGSLRICHEGCAIYTLLIVSGPECGNIWIDDRANNAGIYPSISKSSGQHQRFTDWYAEWLTDSTAYCEKHKTG